MLEIHDHVSRATRASVSRQLDTGLMLGDALMDVVRQYVDLNLNMARATLEQGNLAARQLMSARDSNQFISLAAAQIQPNALRTFDYGYYLSGIAADAQTHVIRAAGGGIAEANREWIELAGKAGEGGPAAWESAMTFFRDMVESAMRLYTELTAAFQPVWGGKPARARPHLVLVGRTKTYR
ncbi:MAG TPA: phasin family protein [Noviherbaspirillum sp.]|nr:phasin family protein [Noviherbaspirillum sp.]